MTTKRQPIGARALTLRRERFPLARLGLLITLLGVAGLGALRAEATPAPVAAPAPAAASAIAALPGVTAQAATLSSAAVAAHGHRHGHHRGHYRHSYRHRHYPRSYGFYFGFPYFSLGYYGHGYYGHAYRYGYHRYPYGYYPGYYRSGSEPLGGVDIDVKPKKAEVFLDGRAIGTVRQFDGYPSYLWLEQGTYELAIYMDGYQTLEREIAVLPGVVIDVEGRLVPGEAVRPEAPAETASADEGRGGAGYDRPQRRRGERAPEGAGEPPRLAVSVSPADAAVYLDGHFLGTAEDLARLSAGMMISPGRHTVEVVRPGYRSTSRDIEVRPGQRFELDVTLEPR